MLSKGNCRPPSVGVAVELGGADRFTPGMAKAENSTSDPLSAIVARGLRHYRNVAPAGGLSEHCGGIGENTTHTIVSQVRATSLTHDLWSILF